MEPDFELNDGYAQFLTDSPHSPAVSVVTPTFTSLPVSTGECQAGTPPCEVSTPYQDALHFRDQAEALYREATQLFNQLTSPSPKRQKTIEEYALSLNRSTIEFAWSLPLTGSALPDNEDKGDGFWDAVPPGTHPMFMEGGTRQLGEGELKVGNNDG